MLWYLEHINESLTVHDAAGKFNLSEGHLRRIFRQYKGCSISAQFRELRLANAKILLMNPALSVSEVGHMCGYTNPSSFSRFFRVYSGIPPHIWRVENAMK